MALPFCPDGKVLRSSRGSSVSRWKLIGALAGPGVTLQASGAPNCPLTSRRHLCGRLGDRGQGGSQPEQWLLSLVCRRAAGTFRPGTPFRKGSSPEGACGGREVREGCQLPALSLERGRCRMTAQKWAHAPPICLLFPVSGVPAAALLLHPPCKTPARGLRSHRHTPCPGNRSVPTPSLGHPGRDRPAAALWGG